MYAMSLATADCASTTGIPEVECQLAITVRREKALVHSGRQTRPGTGSLHPVAIEAAAEATKPLKPSV